MDPTDKESTVASKPSSEATTSAVVAVSDNANEVDSEEVTIDGLEGKHYPSLAIVARANTKFRGLSVEEITQERTELDTKLKPLFVNNNPTKLTEWLMHKGLIRDEQFCNIHASVKLKLSKCSDASMSFSGGYVWTSDCCPDKRVSVFSGSIFENSPFPPVTMLKLIYTWACQTAIKNVVSWLKVVDTLFIKKFYTLLRAVCTAAVCQRFGKMGGTNKKVEVGVIALGTKGPNDTKNVKVEVLGVLECDTKYIRMKATDPDKNTRYRARLLEIVGSVADWVDPDSIIMRDNTVDTATLRELGFTNVIKTTQDGADDASADTKGVMDYMKITVPRTYKGALTHLDTNIIQQFLNELAWRQRFGPTSLRAFESITGHLAEQTKLQTGDTLINQLQKISMDPFKNWRYAMWEKDFVTATAPAPAPEESVSQST